MFRNRDISIDSSILSALKKMDNLDKKLLIVLNNENRFVSLLSIGDLQRAIIQNKSLESPIHDILRKNIKVASINNTREEIQSMMIEYRMELCPVLDDDRHLVEVVFWEDIINGQSPEPKYSFDLPVVIMAGGKGTRLRPLTHVIPKPLIPLDEKTMLEHIFERFNAYGSHRFLLSVNYKSELIEYYINQLKLPFDINYFKEPKALGTAGSLTLIKEKLQDTFFVSNCDILVDQDYSEILDYHREMKNELTVVAVVKTYAIPYGTIETGEKGSLVSLNEKPNLTFKINSGMYILEPHLVDEIPSNQFYHITHLIEKIRKRLGKVGVFPVSEGSWKDIGEWDSYLSSLSK